MIEAKRYPRSVLDMDPSQDVLMVADQAGAPTMDGNEVREVARRLREVGWFGGAGACTEICGEEIQVTTFSGIIMDQADRTRTGSC